MPQPPLVRDYTSRASWSAELESQARVLLRCGYFPDELVVLYPENWDRKGEPQIVPRSFTRA